MALDLFLVVAPLMLVSMFAIGPWNTLRWLIRILLFVCMVPGTVLTFLIAFALGDSPREAARYATSWLTGSVK